MPKPPIKTKECKCEELSCKIGCIRNHTHKLFSCEKCEQDTEEGIDFKIPFIIFTTVLLVWLLAISLVGYIIYSLI